MFDLINAMDNSSSPGVTGWPVKLIKHCATNFARLLSAFMNGIFEIGQIPSEWKFAIVTPLYKGKGSSTCFDNYRGISVLTPIGKMFERIVSKRIVSYFEDNKLFTSDQHGFRTNHSCETALASIIDQWKLNLDDNLISLALFIDFKKAFDLINPKLLFHKLFHYGFDNFSLALLCDYFEDRLQVCKVMDSISDPTCINIGVPQGSVLGPLLFLVYINDLSWNIDMKTFLFADDTTLSDTGTDLEAIISVFKKKLDPLLNWIDHNQLTINWKKTKFMILAKSKVIDRPGVIKIHNEEIEVVSVFKLLGVTIDGNLEFHDHVKNIKSMVNRKLFALKKLSFLSTPVKVQFFKSFVLPHFDYCSALVVFLSRKQLNSLEKFYNTCLFRFLNVNIFSLNVFEQKICLKKYNILPLKIRFFIKLNTFIYKTINSLCNINIFHNLSFIDREYSRANSGQEIVKTPGIVSRYGKSSLSYFLPKFINEISRNSHNLLFSEFKSSIYCNLDIQFQLFINKFNNFI